MESKGTIFNFKVVLFPKMIYIFFFLVTSQADYKTLRKENMMTKRVKNIAMITKTYLAKDYQIVNSKATNPKYRVCFEKCILMQMEV